MNTQESVFANGLSPVETVINVLLNIGVCPMTLTAADPATVTGGAHMITTVTSSQASAG